MNFSLTHSTDYELRVELRDTEDTYKEAYYSKFAITDNNFYTLEISGFSSDQRFYVGDSFSVLNGMKFSTKDRDLDSDPNFDCANALNAPGW